MIDFVALALLVLLAWLVVITPTRLPPTVRPKGHDMYNAQSAGGAGLWIL